MQQAVFHHQAGRLQEAEQLYRAILQAQPSQPDANHNLGVLAGQVGQHAAGLPYLKTALAINPSNGQYSLSYAEALLMTGRAKEALDTLQAAMQQGLDTPAAQALRQKAEAAILTPPAKGKALTSVEIMQFIDLFNAGCHAELESQAYLLLEQYPATGFVWKVLGASQEMQGKDALATLQKATEFLPDDAEAHNNLGIALRNLGQFDRALASFRRALEIKPDYANAYSNLGIALQNFGQLDSAVVSYRQALKIEPDHAEAYNNLGNALRDLGQLDAAAASYRRALEIKPDFAEAHSNLLFICNQLPGQSAATVLAEARRYGELAARKARPYTDWSNPPEADRCLRVGLVSGDLREHPVGYFVEGVLEALATSAAGRLEYFAYSNHARTDKLSERIKSHCQGWRSAVGLSDESLAQHIRDDGIDILIDLSGHTAHNRLPLFAWKPAPVQATWLGYLGTTGVAAIDYLIADAWTLPETEEAHFSETIWRLPESYLCFTPPDEAIQVSSLPAISNGYITFGSFNNLSKINDAVVSLWARMLASVPDSRLYLKTNQLKDATVRQSIAERFAAHGIGPERLILEGTVPQRAEHLASYHRIDIALDPFPYPGITTSVEGLWMGVPVLTLTGECFQSRQGVGLLMNAGLPEWIAADADDYVARAMAHAGDLPRLADLRSGLRQQVLASPIFDAPRFASHFEAALRGMWTQWCDQQREQYEVSAKDIN
ncbi:MAG: tetratricopeptide repeat protein [Burkholderiales bacterium]